ncbi:MAG: class I SAM-dependent methyltransferase [Bacteroidales bacterium]|nr:class I SAM-dependent methyltransferase [Bacteroidales bacterium]
MLAQKLRQIPYQDLPISEYSRRYIMRMLPSIDYYMDIYNLCIDKMLAQCGKAPQQVTMVDYGGGHGFLSLAAKEHGIGQVIYIDYNSLATKTVTAISDHLGFGPDVVLHGDAETLRQWCDEKEVCPDFLMGMDVIEHIYRLDEFFDHVFAINPEMAMLFTTGSTPFNPHVVKRLRKVMVNDELGEGGFLHERRHHIAHSYRNLSPQELDYWAKHTRGLTYDDAIEAVANNKPNILADAYNTCDPATGSWTERILPISDYQQLVDRHKAHVHVGNGFYNTHRSGLKGTASRLLNIIIRALGIKQIAPFIILTIDK